MTSFIKNKKIELLSAILVLLYFAGNFGLSFATDSYVILMDFPEFMNTTVQKCGRVISGLFLKSWNLLGLPGESIFYIEYVLAIICLFFSIVILARKLQPYLKNEILATIVSFAFIANVYIVEFFMFLEKGFFMSCILLNILAFCELDKYFSDKKTYRFILAFVYELLITLMYQSLAGFFFILLIPFALEKSKDLIGYIKNLFIAAMAYVVPCILDLLLLNLIGVDRATPNCDLHDRIYWYVKHSYINAVRTFEIIPHYIQLIATLIILGITLMTVIKIKDSTKRLSQIFNLLVIFLATVLIAGATNIVASGWYEPRIVYPIMSLLGIFAINYYVNVRDSSSMRLDTTLISLSICVVLIFQLIGFNKIYRDKHTINATDKERYQEFYSLISDYQNQSGNVIDTVVFYEDQIFDMKDPELYGEGDFVVSALTTDWSNLNAMNYYLDTDYQKGERVRDIEDFFHSRNWTEFSIDQIVFRDNVMHICVY